MTDGSIGGPGAGPVTDHQGRPPRALHPVDDGDDRELLVPLVRDGVVVGEEPLAASRERHLRSREELPLQARMLSKGQPVIPTMHLS